MTISIVAGLVVVLVFAGVYFFQEGMVYYPTKELMDRPDLHGMEYEDVYLTTSDNVKIHGWFVPTKEENKAPVVLWCHGNGGNISGRLGIIKLLNDARLNVFIFDYHGYGKSEGKPSEKATYKDAEAAWKYLTEQRNFSADKIIIHGRSLGGAIASHLATKHTPGALVIMSSFTSLADMGAELYPYLPVRLLGRFKYPGKENLKKISCPVLIIHSKQDQLIPYHHGQNLFEAASEPKRFLEVNGGHNDILAHSSREYAQGLASFIEDFIK